MLSIRTCLLFIFVGACGPKSPMMQQQCLPWFTDEPAPPGLENLGVCGLPQ